MSAGVQWYSNAYNMYVKRLSLLWYKHYKKKLFLFTTHVQPQIFLNEFSWYHFDEGVAKHFTIQVIHLCQVPGQHNDYLTPSLCNRRDKTATLKTKELLNSSQIRMDKLQNLTIY